MLQLEELQVMEEVNLVKSKLLLVNLVQGQGNTLVEVLHHPKVSLVEILKEPILPLVACLVGCGSLRGLGGQVVTMVTHPVQPMTR